MPKKKTKEEFIKEVDIIHNYKYNYSKINYINNKTKVCIICPEHGEFWQTPNEHLMGNGCINILKKYFKERKSNVVFTTDDVRVLLNAPCERLYVFPKAHKSSACG